MQTTETSEDQSFTTLADHSTGTEEGGERSTYAPSPFTPEKGPRYSEQGLRRPKSR